MLEIGNSLRDARERRGLGLPEAEAATSIRARYLEALEHEQFEKLPAGPYARSFLRSYAEFLGLDGETYVREYDDRFTPAEPELLRPASGAGAIVLEFVRGSLLTRTGALVLVVAVVGVGVWELGSRGGTPATKPPLSSTRTPAPTRPRHPAAALKPAPRPPAALLALTAARGSCWLSVRLGSRAGRTIFERTLRQGETVKFGLRKPLWIRLGAPEGLDATIGGRSVTAALPSLTGDVVATAAGLRAAA